MKKAENGKGKSGQRDEAEYEHKDGVIGTETLQTTRKVEKPNTEFLYRGNDIVKLWEQYLKSLNQTIKFYLGDEGYVGSIFNGLAQNKEVAIVTNPDNTPYQNKDGKTITLCGEINYKGADVVDKSTFIEIRIREVIEQIKSYNDGASHGTKITNHIVIFPYHTGPLHWNLGQIELKFNQNDNSLLEAYINIYEPYGGQASGYKDLIKDINSLDAFNIVKIRQEEAVGLLIKQQYDSSSCGAITAENGKEFLKHQADENNLLNLPYTPGASKLRERHIQEINEEAFFIAQRDNKAYAAKGDKSIEHQFEITQLLKKLIQKSENDWIKQVIILTQAQEDDVIRDNLDLFKQFLIQLDLSDDTNSKISGSILRPNGSFKEGAIDLIKTLAWNINNNSSRDFSNNSSSNKEQPLTSKTQIDQRKLKITGPQKVATIEKDTKLLSIKEKLEKNEELSLADFKMECEFTYSYNTPITIRRNLFTSTQEEVFALGKSDNFLFFYKDVKVLQRINFDISKVLDSKGNNILHYAVFQHNLNLVTAILNKAKSDGIIENIINHHNVDGTNPLGMAFLFKSENNLAGIEVATIFVGIYEYQINDYLNNKVHMDYSNPNQIGGTNLLHNVILAAAKCTDEGSKEVLSAFFKVLSKRIITDQVEDESYFNPNYPTMNPSQLTQGLDGHMISTSKLLQILKFSSKKIQQLCKKYFDSILQSYEANQFDDSSGDSEDESSHAYTYKEMLLEFNEFIKKSLNGDLKKIVSGNFQRTFDGFSTSYGIAPAKIWESVSTNDEYDEEKWNTYWQKLNVSTKETSQPLEQVYEKYKADIGSIVVPLFHGVPFMHSQYTNYQRREVVKKIFEINRKLLGKFDGTMTEEEYTLTPKEKILIGIHSRTSTATAGMQSLYEIMVASDEDLHKLDAADSILLEYFKRNSQLPTNFKTAMKDYIFNFAASPIRNFWVNNNDGLLPEDTIVKYRFPVIATSKAPDHPIRFAIGRNVEGATRGENPMQPEYIDGYPTHRLAGLVYITLHKLSDLVSKRNEHTMIDVNQGLKIGKIEEGRGAARFTNQLECDFLGKIDSDKIVAVIPIIYPNIKEKEHFEPAYHQAIYGLSPNAKSNTVVSPMKIKQDVDKSPNPDIMSDSSNISGFGKMIIPSIVGLTTGVVVAIAKLKDWFICTINGSNELVPYEVGFDQTSGQFSKAQQTLKPDDSSVDIDRFWQYAVQKLKQEEIEQQKLEIFNAEFVRLSLIYQESNLAGDSALSN
jgi:hypothetical protein